MELLIKGENKIVRINIYASDGVTAIPPANFASIKADIYQFNTLLASYTLGEDDELRVASDKLELEVTTDLSDSFGEGIVQMLLDTEIIDPLFLVDNVHKDKATIPILQVKLK